MPLGPNPKPSEFEILILGVDGFIGSHLVRHFRDHGYRVWGSVFFRTPKTDDEFPLDARDPGAFTGLNGELRRRRGIAPGNPVLRGVPVINAVGVLDQRAPTRLMRDVHIGGMKNLVDFCRAEECPHVVQLSSVAVYGNATVGMGRDERSTPRRDGGNPLTASLPYGRTKAQAEAMLEASGLPWSAPRLPAVFGPGDTFLTPSLWRFISRGAVPFAGGGDAPVSIMDVTALGSLIEKIIVGGPLRRGLNASTAAPPWRDIVGAYAKSWRLPMSQRLLSGVHRWRAMFNFGDAPMQMMAYYSAHGAEFPDGELREATGWRPQETWDAAIDKAASAWVVGYGDAGEWGREHAIRDEIRTVLDGSSLSATG